MTPSETYRARVTAGAITADAAQEAILPVLDRLEINLRRLQPQGFLANLFSRQPQSPPRGIYLCGEVGRGKTMLMDLFFDSVRGLPKRRAHFHAFMQEIHAKRAALRGEDVIGRIADDLAGQAKLLCLDEMQVSDIADAMIIGRLYDALQQRGVAFVTTSNLPPEELYKDGLNRQLFLPFIAKLRESLDVVSLDSPTDYRLGRIMSRDTWITPLAPASTARLDALWGDLTDGAPGAPCDLDVLGRRLHVPRAAHACARFNFEALCENPLGPADYLALAQAFRTVFVDGIPVLAPERRNAAKRFVTMIDTFYDARTRLAATAAAEPALIYPKGQHGFEFKRTASRLKEMSGAAWWA